MGMRKSNLDLIGIRFWTGVGLFAIFLICLKGENLLAAGSPGAAPSGEWYEAEVPDTLDLAYRAGIAINGLAGTLDPESDYEIFFKITFAANPPFMFHDTTGLPTNNPKYAESFPMMRVMSGSDQFLDTEQGMMKMITSLIAEDGLFYSPCTAKRPWHEGVGHKYDDGPAGEDFANVYGNSRVLLAMMAWMQYQPEGSWRQYAGGIAKGLSRIAVKKEDYAYYPDSRIGEAFSYPKSGWRNTDEPQVEGMGAEGSMFMYHCGPIRALARWYRLTGDQDALNTAQRLVKFVTKKRFWGSEGIPKDIASAERGYFTGHMHGHTAMLFALLEYAQAANDATLKEFVRDGYDFARHHGIPQLGAWLNNQPDVEVCTISDMVALAIKLTDAGMGDYYEDVDYAVRNQLTESQILSTEFLERIAETSPPHEPVAKQETNERVLERSIGTMPPLPICGYDSPYGIGCCTGNGTQGLFYAWSKIIEFHDGVAQINLLLNRVSPWADIDSYLPFQGKVVLHNKRAHQVNIRIPHWVDHHQVEVKTNGLVHSITWLNAYACINGLKPDDRLTVEFPLAERTIDISSTSPESSEGPLLARFIGNTAIEIPCGATPKRYPLYQRQDWKIGEAPRIKQRRFVSDRTIDW